MAYADKGKAKRNRTEYYLKNRDAILLKNKNNREHINKVRRAYYFENVQLKRDKQNEYNEKNREAIKIKTLSR